MNTKRLLLSATVIAAMGTTALLWTRGTDRTVQDTGEQAVSAVIPDAKIPLAKTPSVPPREPLSAQQTVSVATNASAVDVWVEELPPEDRSLGQRIVDAIDNDDLPALKKLMPEVRACANKDVRQRVVEGLDWFGKDAVVEITAFLADKDREVAEAAFNAWDSAVDQVEDEPFRIGVAADVMKTISDPDNLSSAATKLETADDRKAALLALADVAESGNRAAMAAVKEAYEFISGEEWVDVTTARAKAQTIDNDE